MYEAKQTRLGASIHCVKSVRIRSYSDLHFLTFGLNTEKYSISLRIQSECGKMRTRITPNTDTFHTVIPLRFIIQMIDLLAIDSSFLTTSK